MSEKTPTAPGEHMTQTIEFDVQGSADDPYHVTFAHRDDGNLSAHCTCPAGEKGTHCKHRLEILRGRDPGIVSGNPADIKVVQGWIPGSDVNQAMREVKHAERSLDEAKANLSKAKKKLARALLD